MWRFNYIAYKNNVNIRFEKQIWDAACVLWGYIPAAEYRKVIVGLIFLDGMLVQSAKFIQSHSVDFGQIIWWTNKVMEE